jgi:8-oxo-dGTP pyrophosphatase MutT (NUDIX family)
VVPVRDAATVVLLRDAEPGGDGRRLEVFMVRRSLQLVFGAGAYVFPGGAVDDADRHAGVERVCEGRSDATASAALGVSRGGLAFWVAAVRECFEEAGYLLAYSQDRRLVALGDADVERRFADHRHAVRSGARRLVTVCEEEGLRLAVDAMHYVSRWVTPEGQPRRFDTRFFVCAAPEEQTPLHDAGETIAHEWLAPADALRRNDAGEIDLMVPTRTTLQWLTEYSCVTDVLDAAAAGVKAPAHFRRG